MDAIVCQAAEEKVVEIVSGEQAKPETIMTLSSADLSFIGGGLCVVFI